MTQQLAIFGDSSIFISTNHPNPYPYLSKMYDSMYGDRKQSGEFKKDYRITFL